MKRRFLATLLTAAMLATMFAGLTVMAATQDVVTTFIDNYVENNTSDFYPSGCTYPRDEALDTMVAKYEKAVGSARTTNTRGVNTTTYPNLAATKVLWGEISIKYEDAFTRFDWEHDQASPPVWIDDDGSVKTGGYNVWKRDSGEEGTDTGYDLELGKWYHIVSALDYTNSTTGAITIWINGEKIVDAATPYYRLQGTKGFAYISFFLAGAKDTASTVYVDNFRSYTTDRIDSHPEDTAILDGNADDEISLSGNYIVAPGATVGEIKAGLTNGSSLIFVKKGAALADDAAAKGATAYEALKSGKGWRTYEVVTSVPADIAENYMDYSFDNWTTKDSHFQANGSSSGASWNRNNSERVKSYELATDAARKTQGLKLEPVTAIGDTTEAKDKCFFSSHLDGHGIPDKYPSDRIVWNEFSVKYEGQFVSMGFDNDNAVQPVSVDYNGKLRTGMQHSYKNTPSNSGTDLNYSLELGKWYHIVSALDLKAETPEVTIWVNGEKIADKIGTHSLLAHDKAWKTIDFTMGHILDGEATVYVDNLKVYTTTDMDDHAEVDFDIDVAFGSDVKVYEDQVEIPKDATVAGVKELIEADNYIFVKDGEVLGEGALAAGSTLYVNASNGIGFKCYSLVEEIVYPTVNVMRDALNSIAASIRPRNDTVHNASKMADGSKVPDDYYKSSKTDAEKDGLKVIASLNAVYSISSVTVTERNMGDQGLKVTVEIGKDGNLTKVVDSQGVNEGSGATETEYTFDATEGDTIVYTFNVGTHRPDTYDENGNNVAESDYQIYELEAFGVYVGDVAKTGLIPEIGFWYYDSDNAIISYYINCYNAGDEEVNGKFFIAAYENNKLVKLVSAKDVTISKGANTLSCTATSGIYDPTCTYKAFIWNNMANAKPIVAAVDIK